MCCLYDRLPVVLCVWSHRIYPVSAHSGNCMQVWVCLCVCVSVFVHVCGVFVRVCLYEDTFLFEFQDGG